MNEIEIFKALSNETRLNILKWLKDPENNFPEEGMKVPSEKGFEHAVCVGQIRDKAGVSQSVASQYLDLMQRAGLLESIRIGKWTYYRRKEDNIQQLGDWIKSEL